MTLLQPQDARRFDELVAFRRRLKWRQNEARIVHESARAGVQDAMATLQDDLLGLGRGLDSEMKRLEQRTQRGLSDVMVRVKHDALSLLEGGEEMAELLNRYFTEDKPQERV